MKRLVKKIIFLAVSAYLAKAAFAATAPDMVDYGYLAQNAQIVTGVDNQEYYKLDDMLLPVPATAPYLSGRLPGAALGLENHTNYIYRPGGSMTADEARGLAAYLNSDIVDRKLRAVAGSTQVNATDPRRLPLPSRGTIMPIGRSVGMETSLREIDGIVRRALRTGGRGGRMRDPSYFLITPSKS